MSLRTEALDALEEYGGCSADRADALITALEAVAVDEALAVTAGTQPPAGTIKDVRVERVRQLSAQLTEQATGQTQVSTTIASASSKPLNEYELGTLLRIPASQAKTALTTFRARYPEQWHERMKAAVAAAGSADGGGTDTSPAWVLEFPDVETFNYAVDTLRRYGCVKGLEPSRSKLRIEIPQSTMVGNQDAKALLGIS